jgi:hypothetical protein
MPRDDNLRRHIYCAGYYTGEYRLLELLHYLFDHIFYPMYYFTVLYLNVKHWIVPKKKSSNIL